jgi:hypothetical protein
VKRAILAVLFLFGAVSAHSSELSTKAVALAPGAWDSLNTINLGIFVKHALGGNIGEWGGQGTYYPSGDKVILCGTSHHDTTENDCIVYTVSTNTWSSIGLPTGISAIGPSDLTLSFVHAYSQNAIDISRGHFYMTRARGREVYRYDINAGTWSTLPLMPDPGGCEQTGRNVHFSPDRDQLLVLIQACGGMLFRYSPATLGWLSTVTPISGITADGGGQSVGHYSSLSGGLLFFGGGDQPGVGLNFWRLNSNNTATQRANLPYSGYSTGSMLAVDPVTGTPLQFGCDGTIRAYNNTTNTWTNTNVTSHMTCTNSGSFAIPISTYGVVMVVTHTLGGAPEAWIYKHSASTPPIQSQLPIPSMQDERDTYTRFGWTWNSSVENPYPTVSSYNLPTNYDIHDEFESDDLWANLMQYRRRGDAGYLTRANAWATWYKANYSTNQQFVGCANGQCESSFGADHTFGWGLIDWYLYTCNTSSCDTAALTKAEAIGTEVQALWTSGSSYYESLVNAGARTYSGPRRAARHLQLITRLAEVTGLAQWVTLRDLIFTSLTNKIENPPTFEGGWNTTYKMYFLSAGDTDETLGTSGHTEFYTNGTRIVSTFQIGTLAQAFWDYYRVTGNATARQRIIDMAEFVNNYGMDRTFLFSCPVIGVRLGAPFCHGLTGASSAIVDPNYTISLVNLLVMRYKLTGETAYLDKAKVFFNRGSKFKYNLPGGEPIRETSDTTVGHFVDTQCGGAYQVCSTLSDSNAFLFARNRGELQYTYMIFENGGLPTTESAPSTPPTAPTNLVVRQNG